MNTFYLNGYEFVSEGVTWEELNLKHEWHGIAVYALWPRKKEKEGKKYAGAKVA